MGPHLLRKVHAGHEDRDVLLVLDWFWALIYGHLHTKSIWNLKQVPKMWISQNQCYFPTFPPRFWQFGQALKTPTSTKGLAMSALYCSTDGSRCVRRLVFLNSNTHYKSSLDPNWIKWPCPCKFRWHGNTDCPYCVPFISSITDGCKDIWLWCQRFVRSWLTCLTGDELLSLKEPQSVHHLSRIWFLFLKA